MKKILILSITFILILSTFSFAGTLVEDTVSFYDFEDLNINSIGSNYLFNEPLSRGPGTGQAFDTNVIKYGTQSIVFTGDGSLSKSNFNKIEFLDQFTLSFWYYPTDINNANIYIFFFNGLNNNYNNDLYLIQSVGGGLWLSYPGGGFPSASSVNVNEWNYIEVQFDGPNNTFYLKVNGNTNFGTSSLSTTGNQLGEFALGGRYSSTSITGNLDNVQIINRTITDEESDLVANFSYPNYCIQDWQCTNWMCNGVTGVKSCDSVTDTNTCGPVYSGDYSEYLTTCPIYIEEDFDDGSTDLDTVEDYNNVTDFTVVKDTSTIQWVDNVNISGVNLSEVITVGTGFVSVNHENLDVVADVLIDTTPIEATCGDFELYYADNFYSTTTEIIENGILVATEKNIGGDCLDETICKDVACVGGQIQFEAQHFDGFAIQADQSTRESCLSTRSTIYAAFGILAVIIIALAAFAIMQVVNGDFNTSILTGIAITAIGLAIILIIGYIIISNVGSAICY